MSFLMILMLATSLAIKANYYSQLVTWALFAYIIAREIIDYIRVESKPDRDAKKRRQIMDKLNKILEQLKRTV